MHPRLAHIAAAATGSENWLLEQARSRIGRHIHAAAVLVVHAGPLGGTRRGAEQLVVALSEDDVHLLDYHARTIAPGVGGVVQHLPRAGVVAQWHRRLFDVKVELSWPDQHVFLTGGMRPGQQSDRLLGQLIASELDQL